MQRRITRLDEHRDWGWQIVNYGMFRGLRTAEDRKSYMREYMRQRRKQPVNSVNLGKPQLSGVTQAEAEAEADTEADTKRGGGGPPPQALKGLELYENDATLIRAWSKLDRAWAKAYPGLDVAVQVREAHAWEISDPKHRRKRHGAFLNNWLKIAYQRERERRRTKDENFPAYWKPFKDQTKP